jgi:hypothetical protein
MSMILVAVGICVPQTWAGEEKTFKGEIADSQCALNVHSLNRSHKEMMEPDSIGRDLEEAPLQRAGSGLARRIAFRRCVAPLDFRLHFSPGPSRPK